MCTTINGTNKTTDLAGDMNIDVIKFSNEDVVFLMSTLMASVYFFYMTIPSHITQLSATCNNNMLMKTYLKYKMKDVMSRLFYYEIAGHLSCFIQLNGF